jgi:GDP-L-fucose synthase
MRVIVTGASGFLGSFLCSALERQGHDVTRPTSGECDLTRDGALDAVPGTFDRIFHLAAWTQAGDFCLRHPGEQWVINQRINTNVLDWWRTRQPGAKLVCMGSSCAYDPALPLVEENYLAGQPIDSLFAYAMTKRMLYAGLVSLRRQFGLTFLCLVPSTLYGPGYHTDGRQMHFIFDLVRKILRGKLCGDPVVLWGDGHQRRELVYVDDFVEMALALADGVDNTLVNVGAGEDFPIRHFAQLICERVGYDAGRIRYDTDRYVGAASKCLAVNRLRRYLPDACLTPLETGLDRTIAWFTREGAPFLAAGDGGAREAER